MLLFNIIEASELRVIGANGVHACPGSTLTLECTVNGGARDTTVWEGTAFSECEISLLHLRFGESGGTVRTCNNGAITGRSVSFIRDTTYISQLVVKITTEMIRRSIECTHDNGTVHTIGHHLINIGKHNT